MNAGTCNQKCIELLFRLRLPIIIINQSPLPLLFLSLSPYNSTYPSLASCTRMIIHLSIDHLHLRSHLVQSFSEFGVVLPISHCTSHKKRAYLQERLLSPGSVFVYQLASSLFSYREDIQVMAFANSPSVLANFPLISNHLIASSIFPCCRQS